MAAPLVVLAMSRGRRVGLAWGVLLMGVVAGFGTCMVLVGRALG